MTDSSDALIKEDSVNELKEFDSFNPKVVDDVLLLSDSCCFDKLVSDDVIVLFLSTSKLFAFLPSVDHQE